MRHRYYSPRLSRLLVCALYHEAKSQRKPMTHLVDELLSGVMRGSASLSTARAQLSSAKTVLEEQNAFG